MAVTMASTNMFMGDLYEPVKMSAKVGAAYPTVSTMETLPDDRGSSKDSRDSMGSTSTDVSSYPSEPASKESAVSSVGDLYTACPWAQRNWVPMGEDEDLLSWSRDVEEVRDFSADDDEDVFHQPQSHPWMRRYRQATEVVDDSDDDDLFNGGRTCQVDVDDDLFSM